MFRRLSSLLVVVCMLVLLLPFGAATATTPKPSQRVGGSSRYGTASNVILNVAFPSTTATTVVLTGGGSGIVAAVANGLAGSLHAPLLFTGPNALMPETANQLNRLGATRVIIVGDTSVVGAAVESPLAGGGSRTVTRYGGATNEDVARNVAVGTSTEATSFSKRAFLVASEPVIDWRATFAVASLSYSQGAPILFTGYSSVPAATMQTIANTGIDHVTILGSDRYVSDGVASQLTSAGVTVDRIVETARKGLSAAAAEYAMDKGWASFSTVVLGSNEAFPDDLAGPEAAAVKGGVFLMAGRDTPGFATQRAIGRHLGEVVNRYELAGSYYAPSDASVSQAYSGLPASAVMTGTVVSDETSLPLPGIRVTAYGWDETDSIFRVFHAAEATTDADGDFTMDGLEPGRYWITYSDPSGTHQADSYPNAPSTPGHGDLAFAGLGGVTIQSLDGAPRATVLESLLTTSAWQQQRIMRLQGKNRYDTALEISRKSYRRASTAILVTGNGFADALSASALAGAYRAPLLLTQPTVLPEGLVAELQRLGVSKVFIVGGESVVSAGIAKSLGDQGFTVQRIKGATRYETSANVYRYLRDTSGLPTVAPDPFIVRGDDFPDALSAAPFAYRQVRPILLTQPNTAPAPLKSVFTYYGLDSAIVIGSTKAVSDGVIVQIGAACQRSIVTQRLQGKTRYLTALAVANHFAPSYDFIGVATGQNYPDALAGGVLAGARGGALVLTPTSAYDPGARDFIKQNSRDLQQLRLFGSQSALSVGVEAGATSSANGQ